MPDDFDWDQLLEAVQRGSVIPVIGRELYRIAYEGHTINAFAYLARELADTYGVRRDALPDEPTFADVICSDPTLTARFVRNAKSVYSRVAGIYEAKIRGNPAFPIPASLLKLAEIEKFRLFVSLTSDDLLHRALESVRGSPPVAIDNEKQGFPDLSEENLRSGRSVVYRLFGRLAHYGEYALTEEDMIEFMHWLPDRAYRPERLFDLIFGRDLLLIGAGLPDWIACFFLRAMRRARLSRPSDFVQYVADRQISSNVRLCSLLQNFGTALDIFSEGDPVEFVDELHARCKRAGLAGAPPRSRLPAAQSAAPDIFLSYASEDAAVAASVRQRLEADGYSVWFDKGTGSSHRLTSGAEYEQQIRDCIAQCKVFVAVLSAVMTSFEDRFFRKEWRIASERLPDFYGTGRAFIIPILIDDTPIPELRLPRDFREREIKRAPGGMLTPEILGDLGREIRRFSRP